MYHPLAEKSIISRKPKSAIVPITVKNFIFHLDLMYSYSYNNVIILINSRSSITINIIMIVCMKEVYFDLHAGNTWKLLLYTTDISSDLRFYIL